MESHTVVTRLLELARRDPKYLEDLESCRRAITVMFTDIHGSTAYFEKHGDAAGLLLVHECNSMIRTVVESHGGRIIKTIGDGSMATFEDCAEAVKGAMEMQAALADMNALRNPDEHTAIRIGLHYGSGIVRSNDVFGDVVNMASRVESVALPGQIVVSEPLRERLDLNVFPTIELGRYALKGKTGEQLLFEVRWKPDTAPVSSGSGGAHVLQVGAEAQPSYKLQVLKKEGGVGAEYQLTSTLSIGRSEGDIRFPSDASMAALHARIILENGSVFVEDVSGGGDSVFLRVAAAYTLQEGDIIIMGNDAFRFCENAAMMSAATVVGATLQDISSVLNGSVAEFVHLDHSGKPGKAYPLRVEEVQFGRTKGTYTFPEDKLMSRLHARVLQRGEDFVMEDAGSRNGTFVKVRGRAPLVVGSAILVGSRLLKLVESS